MSEMVKIRKETIETLVHINAYNAVYKPKGWVIVEQGVENELDRELREKGLVNENQKEAYIRAKAEKARRHFDDGLFKGE